MSRDRAQLPSVVLGGRKGGRPRADTQDHVTKGRQHQ